MEEPEVVQNTNNVSLTPDEEVLAAIASALTLLQSDLHDNESGVITIRRGVPPVFSPWSDKIFSMNGMKKL